MRKKYPLRTDPDFSGNKTKKMFDIPQINATINP
jgi:hypothetical protein